MLQNIVQHTKHKQKDIPEHDTYPQQSSLHLKWQFKVPLYAENDLECKKTDGKMTTLADGKFPTNGTTTNFNNKSPKVKCFLGNDHQSCLFLIQYTAKGKHMNGEETHRTEQESDTSDTFLDQAVSSLLQGLCSASGAPVASRSHLSLRTSCRGASPISPRPKQITLLKTWQIR